MCEVKIWINLHEGICMSHLHKGRMLMCEVKICINLHEGICMSTFA